MVGAPHSTGQHWQSQGLICRIDTVSGNNVVGDRLGSELLLWPRIFRNVVSEIRARSVAQKPPLNALRRNCGDGFEA